MDENQDYRRSSKPTLRFLYTIKLKERATFAPKPPLDSNLHIHVLDGLQKPYLTPTLLDLDLDEENEADQGHHHEEGQEDPHVEILSGLLVKRTGDYFICCSGLSRQVFMNSELTKYKGSRSENSSGGSNAALTKLMPLQHNPGLRNFTTGQSCGQSVGQSMTKSSKAG